MADRLDIPAKFEPTIWVLTVTAGERFVSPNRHGGHRDEARIRRAWRDAAFWVAKAHKPALPKGLDRVRIDVVLRYTDRRSRDEANMVDAAKPCVDALGPAFIRGGKRPVSAPGYGLIPDDNPTHLDGPHMHVGEPVGRGRAVSMDLYITDLAGLATGRTWTPALMLMPDSKQVHIKRCCNGCGQPVGDVCDLDFINPMPGRDLADVRSECPTCRAAVAA